MYVISDDGRNFVDLSKIIDVAQGEVTSGPEAGTVVLMAQSPGFQTVLVKGGENRVAAAMRAIIEAFGEAFEPRVLDLRQAVGVGDRPKPSGLSVASALPIENGRRR